MRVVWKVARRIYLYGTEANYRVQEKSRQLLKEFDRDILPLHAPDKITLPACEMLLARLARAKLTTNTIFSLPRQLYDDMLEARLEEAPPLTTERMLEMVCCTPANYPIFEADRRVFLQVVNAEPQARKLVTPAHLSRDRQVILAQPLVVSGPVVARQVLQP